VGFISWKVHLIVVTISHCLSHCHFTNCSSPTAQSLANAKDYSALESMGLNHTSNIAKMVFDKG
jgi:hypothetical protein